MRQVIVYPGESGYFVAECPSLPGCISQGVSKEDALKNIKEAIMAYTEALEDQGLPLPVETFEAMLVAL
jgi:predicted RNase H-like HicB family nuclease